MKLGDLEFWLITDGTFRLDGGAMFGVIPKPMWEKVAPADARNRILMAMNSLLIHAAGKWILVETGAGDKWDAKRSDIYSFDGSPRSCLKNLWRSECLPKKSTSSSTRISISIIAAGIRHIVNGEAIPVFLQTHVISFSAA